MSPGDLDRLKDEMTVKLLEVTSSDTALQRVRLEIAIDYPVYDPDPASNLRHVAPRDLIKRCACGRLFVEYGVGGTGKLYCSSRCQEVYKQARHRARTEGVA
jgi:hypothetical protein